MYQKQKVSFLKHYFILSKEERRKEKKESEKEI